MTFGLVTFILLVACLGPYGIVIWAVLMAVVVGWNVLSSWALDLDTRLAAKVRRRH